MAHGHFSVRNLVRDTPVVPRYHAPGLAASVSAVQVLLVAAADHCDSFFDRQVLLLYPLEYQRFRQSRKAIVIEKIGVRHQAVDAAVRSHKHELVYGRLLLPYEVGGGAGTEQDRQDYETTSFRRLQTRIRIRFPDRHGFRKC